MTLSSLTKRGSRAGISLTEAAIVLGVVGVIMTGLWSVVESVREAARQERMVSQMIQTVQNIRDIYKGMSGTAAGDLTNYLIGRNALTSDLVRKRTAPYMAAHFWDNTTNGGSFEINANATDRSSFFEIEINSLNQEPCIGLASKITGDGGPKGLISTRINGTAIMVGEVTPDLAVQRCADSAANVITFVYRLRSRGF